MANFRYWAGSQGHRLLFCNPYTFRHPQTVCLSLTDLRRLAQRFFAPDHAPWTPQAFGDWVQANHGNEEELARVVLARRKWTKSAASWSSGWEIARASKPFTARAKPSPWRP